MRAVIVAGLLVTGTANADAPRVFQVVPHTIHVGGEGKTARFEYRSFVLLDQAAPWQVGWRPLAPLDHDGARIADAPRLVPPLELTLLGGNGAHVTAIDHRVYLEYSQVKRDGVVALEFPTTRMQWRIALAGKHPDAKLIPLDRPALASPADQAWVAQHLTTNESASIAKLRDSSLEAITATTPDGGTTTLVRSGSKLEARFEGKVMSGLVVGGRRYVLVSSPGGRIVAISL